MQLDETQVQFIVAIKNKVRKAQYEALKVVNVHLIKLYWEIGQSIAEKQSENWGKSIVTRLSAELQAEFPGIAGFSATNLWLMAQFYTEYNADINLQPLVGEIIVAHSLKTSTLPIGVATYSTSEVLPKEYSALLPTPQQIQEKLISFIAQIEHSI